MSVIERTLPIEGGGYQIQTDNYGSPALGTATAVHAAVADTGSTITITTAITNPAVPRNVTATPSGTTANVTAVQCIVTGTNYLDQVITETLPAFSAGAATAVTGVKAFKTVTSISQPACGASVSISYGTGAKLGMHQVIPKNTVIAAYLGTAQVRESTAPTVVFGATVELCTISLNSALNATLVTADYYN